MSSLRVMGASLSWLAIRGKSPQTVRAELGLRTAGRRERYPESPLTGAKLPGGWYLLVENHRLKNQYVRDSVLTRLSTDCEVITCMVEEHVMCSEAAGWNDGVKTWSVIHEAEKGDKDLRTEGDMPAVFAAIRDRLIGEQDEQVDYLFEIPVELAESLTGYRHDAALSESDDDGFEVFVLRKSILEIVFKVIFGLLGFIARGLFAPLRYLSSTGREIPREVRTSLRGTIWQRVFVFLWMGSWIAFSFGFFRLVWLFHARMYPGHELPDFWGSGITTRSFIPSFLMVFAPVPGAMSVAFLLCNIFMWCAAPPVRRAYQDALAEQAAAIFWRVTWQLFKFTLVTLSAGMLIALAAASILKSLR